MTFWLMAKKKTSNGSLTNLERFDCKDDEWLTSETPIDFRGMDITMDDDNVYMSMETYIEKMLNIMGMSESDTLPKDTLEPGLQT